VPRQGQSDPDVAFFKAASNLSMTIRSNRQLRGHREEAHDRGCLTTSISRKGKGRQLMAELACQRGHQTCQDEALKPQQN
jgi:hypothetical protein